MSLLATLLNDPAPAFAFEISEAGVAFARAGAPQDVKFHGIPPRIIEVSPVHDNVQQPEKLSEAVMQLAGPPTGRKRRAALIIPDYAARVTVLDFDRLPDNAEEQLSLIRFRLKKSVPFDLDAAILSYHVQPRVNGSTAVDVVAAIMAREVVVHYEDAVRAAGFWPGYVTTSAAAALHLLTPDEVTVLAKLSGRALSVMVLQGSTLKLARCIELDQPAADDIMGVLHPTMIFIEDQLGVRAKRMVACGFGPALNDFAQQWHGEWGVMVAPLQSRFGVAPPQSAGLIGYMESLAA